MVRCDEFITRLEDRHLQEGGPWPQDLLIHACCCPRCAEILTIFQSIPTEVSRLPRGARPPADVSTTVVLSVHEGIQASPHPLRRLWIALSGIAAAAALVLVIPAQLGTNPAGVSPLSFTRVASLAPLAGPWRPAAEGRVSPTVAMESLGSSARPTHVRQGTPSPLEVAPAGEVLAAAAVPVSPPATRIPGADAVAAASTAAADAIADAGSEVPTVATPSTATSTRRVTRRGPAVPELPRVRVGQGLVLLSDEWGDGAGYGGEIGVQNRIWLDRHIGVTLDTGVRYGVAPGFDPLPDARERSSTAGNVAGTGSVMLSLRARPATLGLGVGISAGEWDPGPGACSGLNRDVPERSTACDDWAYVSPDLVAALEFAVSDNVSLGVRWAGHEQALELGRGGVVDAGGAWINRVTIDATFRPGSNGGLTLASASDPDDDGPAVAHGIIPR